MSVQVCDGHTETGEACDGRCDPHHAEMRRLQKQQRAVEDVAYTLYKEGREDEAMVLYSAANEIWDDAIHFASPANGHVSLCGVRGRNLIAIDDRGDVGGARCWSCLHERDRLAKEVPA